MPKYSTILQLFVASPSDVADERSFLDHVVAEQNRFLQRSIGITYEVVKWETDVTPGFGSEPQDVINRQIKDDYDVFIGIFWIRAGTPTKNSSSGSIEEFQRALARYKRDGSPEIMVYFKTAAVSPDLIDLEQYRIVKDFKASLSGQGGLYSTFEDQPGFESSLRTHLALVAHRAAQSLNPAPHADSEAAQGQIIASSQDDEELGYLDYIDIHEDGMKQMNACMASITRLMGNQSTRTSERTKHFSESLDDSQRARAFLSLQAEDMRQFAKELEPIVANHARHRESAFDALGKAITMQSEFGGEQAEEGKSLRENLAILQESIIGAKESTIGMREATQSLPRLTKELNVAKRLQVQSIDSLIREIEMTSTNVANVLESIDRLV